MLNFSFPLDSKIRKVLLILMNLHSSQLQEHSIRISFVEIRELKEIVEQKHAMSTVNPLITAAQRRLFKILKINVVLIGGQCLIRNYARRHYPEKASFSNIRNTDK